MASYLHRTAQPSTLATFRSWGSSTGAGRIRLATANIGKIIRDCLILGINLNDQNEFTFLKTTTLV